MNKTERIEGSPRPAARGSQSTPDPITAPSLSDIIRHWAEERARYRP